MIFSSVSLLEPSMETKSVNVGVRNPQAAN